MNKLNIFGIISVIILSLSIVLSSCGGPPARTLVPPAPNADKWAPGEPVAGDSIVLFDSGPSYVGNSASANKNNYPSVVISQAVLTHDVFQLHVSYRADIEGPKGETRYDIIYLFLTGKDLNTSSPQNSITAVKIYTTSVPEGLKITEATQWTGDLSSGSILMLDFTAGLSAGKHKLDLGIFVNGIDFGTLPCTLNVTK